MALDETLRLEIRPEVGPEALRIAYRVRNLGPDDLYLYDCPVDAGLRPKPGGAYATFEAATRTLVLALAEPPIPAGLRVYAKLVPLSRRLAAFASASGAVELALPALVQNPYEVTSHQPTEVEEFQADRVVLAIEGFRVADGFFATPVEGQAGRFQAHGYPTLRAEADFRPSPPIRVEVARPRPLVEVPE